jgi:hypothetical protein
VKGLGCLSKGMRQQIHRLRPLVGYLWAFGAVADVQRPTHGPWLVKLLYQGVLTDAVVEQARQGRVRTIDSRSTQGAWCGPGAQGAWCWLGVVPRGPGAAGRGRLATRTGYIAHTVTAEGTCRGPNGQDRSDA